METTRAPRCCPTCSTRLLPEETVCPKCVNDSRLPPRKTCPWCGEALMRGSVICRYCHADLAIPEEESTLCPSCGTPLRGSAPHCYRCGRKFAPGELLEPTDPRQLPATEPDLPLWSGRSPAAPRPLDPPTGLEAAPSLPASSAGGAPSHPTVSRPGAGRRRLLAALWGLGTAALLGGLWQSVVQGWMPVPGGPFDVRCTAWMTAHFAAFGLTTMLALAARCVVLPPDRGRVWSLPALAWSITLPMFAAPWMLAWLLAGLGDRMRRLFAGGATDVSPAGEGRPGRSRFLSEETSEWPTAAAWGLVSASALLATAVIWPSPWRPLLPPAGVVVLDWLARYGVWWHGLAAVVGVGYLLTAAVGWYWETHEDGSPAAWLTTVVVLAPWLIFLSAALLIRVGRDVSGDQGTPVLTSVGEASLFWGLASLYGLYYVVVTWPAVWRHAATSVVGHALWLPLVLVGWEAARIETHRAACAQRLETLAAALREYLNTHQALPPAILRGPAGEPLLSWRVALLPFLGEGALYAEFRLDEPWDSPHNRRLLERRPPVYACDEFPWDDAISTVFVVPVGERTLFPPQGTVSKTDLGPGDRQQVVLLEAAQSQRVPWTAPQDWDFDARGVPGRSDVHEGSPWTVNLDAEVLTFARLVREAGGETDVRRRFLLLRLDSP